jgi:hypothetical protein
LADGKSEQNIKETMQFMILSKLNTFSLSLLMIELLHNIVQPHNINKLITNYGGDYKKNEEQRKKIETISPTIAKFYELMLKMNVPSFPNRISTHDALEFYVREIYTPIKNKYNLPELDFLPKIQITIKTPPREPIRPITIKKTIRKPKKTTRTTKKTIDIKTLPQEPKNITKKCPPNKVLNPKTNRCIKKDGTTYKTIKNIIKPDRPKKTTVKTHTTVRKICRPDQILNPITNRCVAKDGVTGLKLKKGGLI